MKVIFRLKSADYLNKEDYISLARNIIRMWDNMKDLDAMVISKDIEVYVADDDSKSEVIFDGKQESGEVEAIPIEWIEKFIDNDILSETVKILLNAWYWEKENG